MVRPEDVLDGPALEPAFDPERVGKSSPTLYGPRNMSTSDQVLAAVRNGPLGMMKELPTFGRSVFLQLARMGNR